MTGEVTTPAEPTPPASDSKPDPKPPAEPEPKAAPDAAPAQQSVFSAWGFDVNAVASNISIGGLFSSPDDPPEKAADSDADGGDIGATAANIATAASAELEHASKAAQETIGKAAEEIGRGWGNLNSFLDDMLTPPVDGDDRNVSASFHSLFPDLDEEDQVVDHFQCALIQKYRCYLNNDTPEKAYPLRGRLFISTSHIAMYVTDDAGAFGGQPFGITVPFADVGKIQKGAKAMLKLVTKAQQSYIFADFESDSHFSGALSLLEHMAASGSAPPAPKKEETASKEEKPAAG